MAKQEQDCLPSQYFYKIILFPENEKMKLPSNFVKEYGNNFSAFVNISTGAKMWKMEVEREQGDFSLHRGWSEFMKHYSVKYGHLLLFGYEGGSNFRVSVFDTSTMEIEYGDHDDAIDTLVESETNEEEEDDNDECIEPISRDNRSSKRSRCLISSSENVFERAKALESPNPSFIVKMQTSYLAPGACLDIPQNHAKNHFFGKENNGINISNGEDERVWFFNYQTYVNCHHGFRVRLSSVGWRPFVEENDLQLGDVCVFELVDSSTMKYKVTIFRASDSSTMGIKYRDNDASNTLVGLTTNDDEEDDNDECMEPIPCNNRSSKKRGHRFISGNDKGLEQAKALAIGSPNPSFIVTMQKYHFSRNACLYVPLDHGKTYFLGKENNGINLSDGEGERVWFVKYQTYFSSHHGFRARLMVPGWRSFSNETHLELGDVCFFELVDISSMTYKVTVFRASDYA